MAVDFATFSQIVEHVTAVRKPVLLRGRHGIGKSTVVYQYAKEQGLPVVERRASQMTEGDLLGLPDLDDAGTLVWRAASPRWRDQPRNVDRLPCLHDHSPATRAADWHADQLLFSRQFLRGTPVSGFGFRRVCR